MSAILESNDTSVPPEQKFFLEAAKRKRSDGLNQFEQLHFSNNDRLQRLANDPFADHEALDKLPNPIDDDGRIKFLILGAGMGGIVQAIKLIKKGFSANQILLVDSAGGVGGTWYWARYPGLHCDVEAYCYMLLLEETGYIPKQKYASGVEIRGYLEDLVKRFGLASRILFRSQVTQLRWDETLNLWNANLTIRRGKDASEESHMSIRADFVTLVSGVFPYPQVPRVPGLSDFGGKMFHTSRWNHDITGGASDAPFPELTKLKGMRVGIIGTGATAIQAVPQISKYAQEVFVFQRTPSQVFPRGQRDTDPTEWREKIAAKPGWQKDRMQNLAEHISGHIPPDVDNLVNDEWSKLEAISAMVGGNKFGRIAPEKVQEHIETLLALDAEHSKRARDRVHQLVKDTDTARKLTPWYPTWCKRPTFSDLYLDTFNNDHVHLIDTDGKGIDSITPQGIIANGQEFPIDILILSTGYSTPAGVGDPGAKTNVEILGRNGRKMADKYSEQGICTLHGVVSNGYPNLFFQSIGQGGATANYAHNIETLSEHITCIIAQAHARFPEPQGQLIIETSAAAEDAWGMQLAAGAAYFAANIICTPSYANREGEAFIMPPANDQVAMMKKAKATIWQKGMVDFDKYLETWREKGTLEGIDVSVAVKA